MTKTNADRLNDLKDIRSPSDKMLSFLKEKSEMKERHLIEIEELAAKYSEVLR